MLRNVAGAEQDFSNAIKVNEPVVTAYLDKMKKYATMNEFQKSTSDMPDGFVYNHDLASLLWKRFSLRRFWAKTMSLF
ncbi:MAG: hypothetical protein IPH89_13615 [Bacteroidetes bacterium]|nr:hypothetical protein [Bacteroidota bacterium]